MESINEQYEVEFYKVNHPNATIKNNLVSESKLTSNEISFIKEVDCIFLNKERYTVGKLAFDNDSKKLNVFVTEDPMPKKNQNTVQNKTNMKF